MLFAIGSAYHQHGKRVQLFSMTGVAMIVVQPEDGLQFRMAGLVCSPTGARVRVIDPAKDCSDGLFECSLAPAADTSLQRRCLLALLSQCGDAAECDVLLATLAEHSVGAALDHPSAGLREAALRELRRGGLAVGAFSSSGGGPRGGGSSSLLSGALLRRVVDDHPRVAALAA